MRKWFLASEKSKPKTRFLFYAEADVEVIEGKPVPPGSVMAHLRELPEGSWMIRVNLGGDERESFGPLLDGLKAFDAGFEPADSHTFESRPGFIAVIDMLVQIASTR